MAVSLATGLVSPTLPRKVVHTHHHLKNGKRGSGSKHRHSCTYSTKPTQQVMPGRMKNFSFLVQENK